MILLDSSTDSAVASVTYDGTLITSTYSEYLLFIYDFTSASDAVYPMIRLSNDNASTFHSSGYLSHYGLIGASVASAPSTDGIRMSGTVTTGYGTGTNENGVNVVNIMAPTDSGITTQIIINGTFKSASSASWGIYSSGLYNTAEDNDGVQIIFSSGNIATISYDLYGIAKS